MSLDCVVGPAPLFGQFPHLGQVGEPVLVQQPFSDLRVHAFDPGILRGLARFDEVELHSVLVSPLIHVTTAELRTVVAADDLRPASLLLRKRFMNPSIQRGRRQDILEV